METELIKLVDAMLKDRSESERTEFSEKLKASKRKLNQLLEAMLNPEVVTRWRTIEVLCDGKPRQWNDIKKETKLSPSVLSRAFKKMIKDGWVIREIEKIFPTRVVYTLHGGLTGAGKFLKETREFVTKKLLAGVDRKDDEKFIGEIQNVTHYEADLNLFHCLSWYIQAGYDIKEDITFMLTIVQLMYFWSNVLCLTQNRDQTLKAEVILRKAVDENIEKAWLESLKASPISK